MADRLCKFGATKKAAYVEALRSGSRRGAAAAAAGVTQQTVRNHVRDDPDFAAACDQAELDANELVEDALFRQATKGNTTAIQVWLYNRCPDRWRDCRNLNQFPVEAFLASLPPELAGALREYLGLAPPAGG